MFVTSICCDKLKHTFVATKDLSCHDKRVYRDKSKIVVTCRDKHTFVTTKDVFCHDKHVFVTTNMFVVTKLLS